MHFLPTEMTSMISTSLTGLGLALKVSSRYLTVGEVWYMRKKTIKMNGMDSIMMAPCFQMAPTSSSTKAAKKSLTHSLTYVEINSEI